MSDQDKSDFYSFTTPERCVSIYYKWEGHEGYQCQKRVGHEGQHLGGCCDLGEYMWSDVMVYVGGHKKFTVTEDHLKLLHSSYVGWETGRTENSWGGACIDPEQPYGTVSPIADMLEILGWDIPETGYGYAEELIERLEVLHRGTSVALQVMFSAWRFSAGTYCTGLGGFQGMGGWRLVGDDANEMGHDTWGYCWIGIDAHLAGCTEIAGCQEYTG